MVYKNENGETVNVYHGSDEVDNITWQDEWQDNGFWNPNLIYFHNNVITIKEPTSLYFWLDFCDADVNLGELQQYRVDVAGRRSKYINDKDVKSIYFRETPNLLFIDTMILSSVTSLINILSSIVYVGFLFSSLKNVVSFIIYIPYMH